MPISERQFAKRAGLSRTTLSLLKKGKLNPTVKTLERLSNAAGQNFAIQRFPKNSTLDSRYSTPVVSWLVVNEGFESWKIHFFEFLDEVRRSKDSRLLFVPPSPNLDVRLKSLLAAMVLEICNECDWEAPTWAEEEPSLKHPWFPSNSDALKASALLESPLRFKLKNIFVLENFMRRV